MPGSACSSRWTGAETWKSTLLPGFPQDVRPRASQSPIKGREGATDPVLRSGTNGLFYYAGVAFDRGGNKPSAIFVARYMDLNNREAGDPFGYVDTRLVDSDRRHALPRQGGARHRHPTQRRDVHHHQPPVAGQAERPADRSTCGRFPPGNVYVAYAAFTGSGATEQSVILFSRSTNCGADLEHAASR